MKTAFGWIFGIGLGLTPIVVAVALFAAWVTHIIACIDMEAWVLLIVGALLAPVGVVHGVAIWFGVL